jgi:hypothetical protein
MSWGVYSMKYVQRSCQDTEHVYDFDDCVSLRSLDLENSFIIPLYRLMYIYTQYQLHI